MTDDFENYFATVGKKEAGQFERALTKPMVRLETELAKHLIEGDRFYSLSETVNRPGRNHLRTQDVVDGTIAINENCLFSNALTKVGAEYGLNTGPTYQPPMERVRLGPLQIYTIEFDYPEMEFFKLQLGWLRSPGKKPPDSQIGKYYRYCTRWADFRGVTVCWSGNKSLHIHTVFDTKDYIAKCDEPSPADARHGVISHWHMLEGVLLESLQLTGTKYRPDQALRLPEQYRRMPNGHRIIDNDHHFLGISNGTLVQQITLWEQWVSRASKATTELFHQPTKFAAPISAAHANPRLRSASRAGATLSDAEIEYCTGRLRGLYPGGSWPSFSHLRHGSEGWIAQFTNSPDDANPSSIIREGYRHILLQGRDAVDLTPASLDASLGEMIEQWVDEMNAPENEVVEIEGQASVPNLQFERAFAAATDHEMGRQCLQKYLPAAVVGNARLLVNGPEGAAKTSTLMRYHPQLIQAIESGDAEDRVNPRRALYAFASYDTAHEKCRDFNVMHEGSRYYGIVLPSFARAYDEVTQELGLPRITKAEAAKAHFPSVMAGIEMQQPEVIDTFRQRHADLWAEIGGREPVFFSVHQVAHGWHRSSPTRLMSAPSYWITSTDERSRICREETRLSLLIHDEIKIDTFVRLLPDAAHAWLLGLKAATNNDWSNLSLTEKDRALEAYALTKPRPDAISVEQLDHILDLDFEGQVRTRDTSEYGLASAKDIYADRHDQEWRIASTRWWQDSDARRVVFLTTEVLPTEIARKADPGIKVVHLQTSGIVRDSVDIHPRQGIVSAKLPTAITDWRDKNWHDWFAVSNKLTGVADSMSHAQARGSNQLIGKRVVQTMTFMAPQEYEEIQALNAWCGRSDLVLIRHIDEFNQTAGRNMGFRHQPGARHVLLIGNRLLKLVQAAFAYARYDWTIHLTATKRKSVRGAAARSAKTGAFSAGDEHNVVMFPGSINLAIAGDVGKRLGAAETSILAKMG